MKAGKSSDIVAVLPSRVTNALAASNVSSLVAMPRMSSTNCILGTGFMKWMPMKRSGLAVTEARRVIEIEEVLEATMASGLRNGRSAGKNLALDLFVLGRGLDHEIAVAEPVERRGDPNPVEDRLAPRFIHLALGDLARKQAVDRRQGGVDALLGDILEENSQFPPGRRPARCRSPFARRR